MQQWLPYIVAGGLAALIGTLTYAFTRPSGAVPDESDVALMGATGALAGASKAAGVAEVAAAEEAGHRTRPAE